MSENEYETTCANCGGPTRGEEKHEALVECVKFLASLLKRPSRSRKEE